MADPAQHLILGSFGENMAALHVYALGWEILDRNWRPKGRHHSLELDLVAVQDDTLVFVEVKTRSRAVSPQGENGEERPHESIDLRALFHPQKQQRLVRAALAYLSSHNWSHRPCRFDLILVEKPYDGQLSLEHIENVIELGNIVDRGNATWQP